jgi:hypothetical protein
MLQGYENALSWVNIGYCAARQNLGNSEHVMLEDADCKDIHGDWQI